MRKLDIKHTAGVLLLLCVTFFDGIAQSNIEGNYIFDRQIRFSFSPILYDNLSIKNQGKPHLNSRSTFSAEIGVSYYQHIIKGYGINIGIGVGLAPANLNYYFKAPESSIYRTGIYDYEYLDLNDYMYLNSFRVIPISLQKIFFNSKGKLLSIELGAKLNSSSAFPYDVTGESSYVIDENNTEVKLFDFYLEDNGNRHLMSYFIKFGLIKINEKNNTFHFNLVANYSPDKIGVGWYKFEDLGYQSSGTVEQNINYIGFEIAYGITTLRRVKDK